MSNRKMNKTLEILGVEEINNGACTGTKWIETKGELIVSKTPNTGETIGSVKQATLDDYEYVIQKAQQAFKEWRKVPAPKRGEVVRQMGDALRENKIQLGKLVSWEMGKIYQEGLGEVQEMIDICDFAVGQSRMMYGMTTHSERENHRMFEQYHPLGIVGVISSYNFPVAVWAWNAMLALIAGDVVVWKPSSKVPLSAIAVHKIMAKVLSDNNVPEGVINLVAGSSKYIGDNFLEDRRVPLISATGSTRMGIHVGKVVAERLGRTILELGGNNAVVITKHSDLKMAIPSIVFGAVGTTGQRCTSTRRVIITKDVYEDVKEKILKAYEKITQNIGSAVDDKTLIGPMIDEGAVQNVLDSIEQVKSQGGRIIFGGQRLEGKGYESGCFMVPALAEAENHYPIVQEETFGPLLYLIKANDLQHAMELHNDVPQGLSSAIFSDNIRETELFLSAQGSDCGIANVNLGTSGAEIGGAFGGEKETGGGRESGSDAWKVYMRRQTNTINYGATLPLAQGIKFDCC